MKEYTETVHGGDIYRNPSVTDYSVNSNPLGAPEGVRMAVRESADRIMHYPDVRCDRLREAISGYEGIEKEKILCGNGAAELFFAAVMAVRPKKAVITAPSFSEYERALRTVDAETDYYRLKEENEFRIGEDILEKITEETDMVFLCNPNNPTGQTTEKKLLIKVMKACKQCRAVLVLDECFIDFLDDPGRYECRDLIAEYPELVIIKAFTKIFCMPGVRLGYALCGNEMLRMKMRAMLQPWNVSVMAQEAGVAALTDCGQYLKDTRQFIRTQKQWMIERMEMHGYQVYGSEANYIFFHGKKGLYEKALHEGLLIRDCQNYEGLSEGFYRIAVRTKEENERLITWLGRL